MRNFRLCRIAGRRCGAGVRFTRAGGTFYGLLEACILVRQLLLANLRLRIDWLRYRLWRRIPDGRRLRLTSRWFACRTVRERVRDGFCGIHERGRDSSAPTRRGRRRLPQRRDRYFALDHFAVALGGIGGNNLFLRFLGPLLLFLEPIMKAEYNRGHYDKKHSDCNGDEPWRDRAQGRPGGGPTG